MPVGPTDSQGRPLAEWWQRLVAIILDGIILTIPEDIILRVAINTRDRSLVSSRHLVASVVILSLVFAIVNIVYFAVLNGSGRGQTVGQMALGISVRDEASRVRARDVASMTYLLIHSMAHHEMHGIARFSGLDWAH